MAIFDIFSKRAKRERGDTPDVFIYNEVPTTLRVQVGHIWDDVIGSHDYYKHPEQVYEQIHRILAREYGEFRLAKGNSFREIVGNFFLNTTDHEQALDVIETSFICIEAITTKWEYTSSISQRMSASQAVEELNARFLEHGIGYTFAHGKLIRVDSEFLHSEVVKPTLALLNSKDYKGANDEFMCAHEHYRHRRIKECLAECLKAMESTMKTICRRRKWPYKETDTAKALIQNCFDHALIPEYLQSHFSSLRSSLESGVPTVRNRLGGHGQGPEIVEVPSFYASYLLNLTAATIHFLISAEAGGR